MAKKWKKLSFLVLIAYLAVGFFLWPVIGSIALVCMLAPVATAQFRGREWCGVYCPRGSLWDNVIAKFNKRKQIPSWARSSYFRVGALVFVFAVFGWQMAAAWPDFAAIGLVFLRVIFITTLVGIVLGLVYSPRTWCAFCPMGTVASWFSTGKRPLIVNKASCVNCGSCSGVCPMNLAPYQGAGSFGHPDCIKCGLCIDVCRKGSLSFDKVDSPDKLAKVS